MSLSALSSASSRRMFARTSARAAAGARLFSATASSSIAPTAQQLQQQHERGSIGDLNQYSRVITRPKDQGASQAMLYATDGIDDEKDLQRAMIGIGAVWYEGNPCNAHLLGLADRIKESVHKAGMTGYKYGTVGVSDGISMGTDGMSYSLPSRDLIADSVESVMGGHWLDGAVVIPGCDKNMPGVLIALGRLNRPGIMVYGGTIRPGSCASTPGQALDIVSAFQSYGQYLAEGGTPDAERKRYDIVRNSCPGPGACGGMYTANTIASCAEALGMTLPGSSSFPAEYPEKHGECDEVGQALRNILEKNIRPRDIMTRSAFEDAIALTMALGGSTNVVLHLIAIAHSVGVKLTIDDFQTISDRTPFLADLKPSGKYVMEDVFKRINGIPTIIHYLIENKLMKGEHITVTGKTLAENVDRWTHERGTLSSMNQDVVRPVNKPLKASGHIRILKGNLAPGGAVAKITGKEGLLVLDCPLTRMITGGHRPRRLGSKAEEATLDRALRTIRETPRFDLSCVETMVKMCPNITELGLAQIGKLDDRMLSPLAAYRNLTYLDISDPGVSGPGILAESLKDASVIELLSKVGGTLQTLNISGNDALTDAVITDGIAPNCHSLSSLACSGCDQISGKAFAHLWNGTVVEKAGGKAKSGRSSNRMQANGHSASNGAAKTSLSRIDLSRVLLVDDDAVVALMEHSGPSLTHINLNSVDLITERGLGSIAKQCKSAVTLDLSFCRSLDDSLLIDLMKIPTLQKVLVWGCNRVSDFVSHPRVAIVGKERSELF
ncbi:unnamed protein product [Tilletia controversa]|nr:unnamed protein product [Tilletia controversa]